MVTHPTTARYRQGVRIHWSLPDLHDFYHGWHQILLSYTPSDYSKRDSRLSSLSTLGTAADSHWRSTLLSLGLWTICLSLRFLSMPFLSLKVHLVSRTRICSLINIALLASCLLLSSLGSAHSPLSDIDVCYIILPFSSARLFPGLIVYYSILSFSSTFSSFSGANQEPSRQLRLDTEASGRAGGRVHTQPLRPISQGS